MSVQPRMNQGQISSNSSLWLQQEEEPHFQHKLLLESLANKFDLAFTHFDLDDDGKIGFGEAWRVTKDYLASHIAKRKQDSSVDSSSSKQTRLHFPYNSDYRHAIAGTSPVTRIKEPQALQRILKDNRITMIFFYTPW